LKLKRSSERKEKKSRTEGGNDKVDTIFISINGKQRGGRRAHGTPTRICERRPRGWGKECVEAGSQKKRENRGCEPSQSERVNLHFFKCPPPAILHKKKKKAQKKKNWGGKALPPSFILPPPSYGPEKKKFKRG